VTTDRIGGIVLAGGRSARFGTDKLAAVVDGRPLLEHAIARVQAVAQVVVVVLAPGSARDLPSGVLVAHDDEAYQGPLAGLAAGLAVMPGDVGRVLVVGGDMPSLSPAVLRLLIEALVDETEAAVLDDGGPMPMAVRAPAAASAAGGLLAGGERRLRALPEHLGALVIRGPDWRALDPDAATLRDIDRPTDLAGR
jgi:molybdopterin-guanine dinucleotide biosynthesis protein A